MTDREWQHRIHIRDSVEKYIDILQRLFRKFLPVRSSLHYLIRSDFKQV